MSIFDGLLSNLGNLDDLAAKLGLPADKVNALIESVQGKLGQGGDQIAALTEAAKEHGLSLDSLKDLISSGGEGAQDMLGKLTGFVDEDGKVTGPTLSDIGEIAKSFLGKK